MIWIQRFLHIHLLLNKGLINVYIIKLTKHESDRSHGIVSKNNGIFISVLFQLSVQFFKKLSYSVLFS